MQGIGLTFNIMDPGFDDLDLFEIQSGDYLGIIVINGIN